MIISPHMERELRRIVLARKPTNADIIAISMLIYCLFQNRSRPRLFSTTMLMRRNTTYIQLDPRAHGQAQKARSKTPGTATHRHPQPSPHRCLRHFVPRESVLRLQGPTASALRDAPAPPRGRRFYRRCLLDIRGLSPNLLSGTNHIRTRWPNGPAAQTARSQARAQAVRRNNRARPELEDFLSRLDYRRMHQGGRGEVRYHRSSPQPGTGDGGQKKLCKPT